MAMPTTAITRLDLSLQYTEFDLLMNREGFVGLQILPGLGVGKNAAEFMRINLESLLQAAEDATRAPRSGYKRDNFEFDTDSYTTSEKGLEEVIDDAEMELYGDLIRIEKITSDRLMNRLAMALEQEIVDLVTNETTFAGQITPLSTTQAVSAPTTASPIAVIETAIDTVADRIGRKPNTVVIHEQALRKTIRTDEFIDHVYKMDVKDRAKMGHAALLAQVLDIERVVVADARKNTAGKAVTASLSKMWTPETVLVTHVSQDQDLSVAKPRLGNTLMWNDQIASLPGGDDSDLLGSVIVEEYREENRRGGILRGRTNWGLKIFHKECSQLLTTFVTGTGGG
ncbi:MAG TPA: hypothetical protein DCQ94_06795 [Nitrospira sp.]|jgi:hypothetical protein|nr:hypothetical protein [Nitrospira sp.]